jgi:nucleoside-diphosphate-sugar epimerase
VRDDFDLDDGELGFEPAVSLLEGVATTVEWYRKNADRVRGRRGAFERVGAA